jgi:hypothetical protein
MIEGVSVVREEATMRCLFAMLAGFVGVEGEWWRR